METCTSGSGCGPGRQCPGPHHHPGAAYVLPTELSDLPDRKAGLPDPPSPDGYGVAGDEATRRQGFSRRLRAIGHLFEAEDESQQWPDLHAAIRQARKAYQASGTMPNWEALEALIDELQLAQ